MTTRGRAGSKSGAGKEVGLWVFLAFLAVAFVNFAVWSWATPLFASPDEPTHVARAASVARGQLMGATVGSDRNAMTAVRIPYVLASGEPMVDCIQFRDTVPASCQPAMPDSTRETTIRTYVGRYPPLYYLVVGIPSLFAVSVRGIYLMRLTSALLGAVLVALALFSACRWSRNRLLPVAVMAATTPTVWFLGGVVNPSGLEICAAVCLWTSGAVLLLEHADAPPPGLVGVVAGSFAAFVLTRPLSPLWCAVALVVLAVAGGFRRLRSVLASRTVRWTVPPLAACTAFAVWWIVAQHSLDLEASTAPVPQPETFARVVPAILGRFGFWAREMVGVFGWIDTLSPLLTYVVWGAVVGALVLAAWIRATRGPQEAREAVAVALVILAAVVAPVAIVYREVHRLGIVWQGRDILPVAVGIPVVAAAVLGERWNLWDRRRWLVAGCAATCALLGVAEFAAFFEALRRYAVGVDGPVDFLSGTWQAPLGNTAAVVAALVSVAALSFGVSRAVARSPSPTPTTSTDSLIYGRLSNTQRVMLGAERRPGS